MVEASEPITAESAYFVGNVDAEKAIFAGFEPQLAIHFALFFPSVVMRHHLVVDESSNAGSQHVVLFAEDGSGSDLQHVGRLPVFHTNRLGIVVLIGESGLRMLTVRGCVCHGANRIPS